MEFQDISCNEFVERLASKEPVPGGGGASALVGAVGTALGNMVGSLTVGKKKYAEVEADICALNERAAELSKKLLALMQRDAEVFEPLSKAYGMPRETEEERREKDTIMEKALRLACSVPMEIMEICCEAIEVTDEYAKKGSRLAISDAGVSAAMLGSALRSASLNVYINTKAMKDRAYANDINEKTNEMLDKYSSYAERIFEEVLADLKN